MLVQPPRAFSSKGGLGWQADFTALLFDMKLNRAVLDAMHVPSVAAPDIQFDLCLHVPSCALTSQESKLEWYAGEIVELVTVQQQVSDHLVRCN